MNNLKSRLAREKRFKFYGIASITLALSLLSLLFVSIFSQGYTAFQETKVQLYINFDQEILDPNKTRDWEIIKRSNFNLLIKNSVSELFPDVKGRSKKRKLKKLISNSAEYQLRDYVKKNISVIGTKKKIWVLADDDLDMLIKGYINRILPENERRIDNEELKWIEILEEKNLIKKFFNKTFFTSGDSSESEQSGILGAFVGSLFALSITLVLSFPIGIATAIYLEEFAPKNNRLIDFVEVNINNLAAVPSIIFGLLGLAIFLNFFELPRSAPLVGGMVLSLMTLPTIIISSRVSLKSVPPSIKEGALGVGASKIQAVFHHVVPVAMPGILTGTIIGMARALGESAPLLVIGMVAFIVDIPQSVTDPATALPIQIYLWADTPERGFVERTSAAIMVLLVFLIFMNSLAVYLRKKFEKDIS
jgi:phosphate transport system permease protein|tara:strand:+ start:1237 stop:2496 length:1260 start_codon:yes stop_codon:yes gene_type:complete